MWFAETTPSKKKTRQHFRKITLMCLNEFPFFYKKNNFIFCIRRLSFFGLSEVESIGHRAFAGCSSLHHIHLPDSVITIIENAFEGCHALTHVIVPNSVVELFHRVFEGCTSLVMLEVPEKFMKMMEKEREEGLIPFGCQLKVSES